MTDVSGRHQRVVGHRERFFESSATPVRMRPVKNWTVVDKILAGVAVVVFLAVGGLAVVALRSDNDEALPEGCDGAILDDDLVGDDSPVDALRLFVQSRTDYPTDDSWILESDSDGAYVFVSDNGGHFEVEVRDGIVRRFMKCPSGHPS